MHETEKEIEKVILCGVHTGSLNALEDTTDESMAELRELAYTARAEVVGEMVQNKDHPEASTYFGEGKRRPVDIVTNHVSYYAAQFVIASAILFI